MSTDLPQDSRRPTLWVLLIFVLLAGTELLHATPPATGIWQPVFMDQFSAKHLNDSSWTDASFEHAPISGTTYYGVTYSKSQIKQGWLRLFLEPRVSPGKANKGALHATGPVHTANSFHLQFGFIEMRIRVPKGPYHCEARLLPAGTAPSTASITLFTTAGATPGGLCGGVTLAGETKQPPPVALTAPAEDITTRDHLLALLWNPAELVWYLDGRAVAHSTQVPQEKMYLSLAFHLANTPTTDQDPLLAVPAEFLVSALQIYRKVGEIDTAPPLINRTQLSTRLVLEESNRRTSISPSGVYSTDTFYTERHYVKAITLVFDEPLLKDCAETIAHYQLDGTKVKRVKLYRDQHTLVLEVKPIEQDDLSTLHITGLKDLAGNTSDLTVTLGKNLFVTSPR